MIYPIFAFAYHSGYDFPYLPESWMDSFLSEVRSTGADILHTLVHTTMRGFRAVKTHLAICQFWGMLHRTRSYAAGMSCLPVFA